jgi:hypothetical protein
MDARQTEAVRRVERARRLKDEATRAEAQAATAAALARAEYAQAVEEARWIGCEV